jgi:hypothetical protein
VEIGWIILKWILDKQVVGQYEFLWPTKIVQAGVHSLQ